MVTGTAGKLSKQSSEGMNEEGCPSGQPCIVCATPIRLLRQGQRSTFFCPVCQRS